MSTRALVTGADGLLGSNLTRELLARGYKVRAFVHPQSRSPTLDGLAIERVRGDVRSAEQVFDACDGVELVFHCAALTDVRADVDLARAVNLDGTKNVVDACLSRGVRRLLFVGSASSFEFGPLERPGDERGGFPAAYRGIAYMESKRAAMEHVVAAVRERGLDAVILAPTMMLGPHDTGPSSGEIIARYVRSGLRVTPPGGRNFVDVRDVAHAIAEAVERGERGQCYILGGENLRYRDLFALVADVAGVEAPRATLPAGVLRGAGLLGSAYQRLTGRGAPLDARLAGAACLSTYYSSARAVRELGMPQTPLASAVAASVACLREHGHLPREHRGGGGGGGRRRRRLASGFAGKTALVSGGSRGLGFAIAAELARHGANVVITARSAERLEASRRELERAGARVATVSGDVSDWDDAKRMVEAAVARFGSIDILVNNAGVSMRGELASLAPATCAQVISSNLLGSVYLSRAAVEHVVRARGSIVFISSIAGLFGLPGASVYCASKGALRGFCESLRLELGPSGVHVGVVNLGFTEHDRDKRILAADGALELPDRPAHQTRAEAARHVIEMIAARQRSATLTPVGKLGELAYRLSPQLVERAILEARSSEWRVFKQFSGSRASRSQIS